MLSRSFTKAELQINQLKHKQLKSQIDFAVLQDNSTLKPFHYLIEHEIVLPHQNMTITQFLLIMVHINFQYVSMIEETIFLYNLQTLFHSKL